MFCVYMLCDLFCGTESFPLRAVDDAGCNAHCREQLRGGQPGADFSNAPHSIWERKNQESQAQATSFIQDSVHMIQPIVEERWFSTELRLVALIDASSPDEHYSARILKITRTEPDPGLFVIPRATKSKMGESE